MTSSSSSAAVPHRQSQNATQTTPEVPDFVQREWAARLVSVSHPLPGSLAYPQYKLLSVAGRYDRIELVEFLCLRHPHIGRRYWLAEIASGRLMQDGLPVLQPSTIVRGGNRFRHEIGLLSEPSVASDLRLLFEDESLLVVFKPAPLPVHASGRFNKNTALYLLSLMYPDLKLRPVHRLDAEVCGVLMFAKTAQAASRLSEQFRSHMVYKRYLARVHGVPHWRCIELCNPIGRHVQAGGGRSIDPYGDTALTVAKRLADLGDNTSIVMLTPITGRTHQLRLHLAGNGHPIVNDAFYQTRSQQRGVMGREDTILKHYSGKGVSVSHDNSLNTEPVQKDSNVRRPIQLMAMLLEFRHPFSAEPLRLIAPAPSWVPDAVFDQANTI